MPAKLQFDTVDKAISDYTNGLSVVQAAKKNGIGASTLTRYLNKRGISTAYYDTHKYKFDINYFANINSEEKAYWLGFIAADGSIVGDGRILEITLSQRDHSHLLKFANAINMPIEAVKTFDDNKGYHKTRISVCSVDMCKDLARHGIVPRKGFELDFPKNIADPLLSHYLRGYFDGDGSISTNGTYRKGNPKYAVNLIATKSFLEKFMQHLEDHLMISKVSLQQKGPMFVWNKVGILQITRFLDYLYQDVCVYLERKYCYYLSICRPEPTVAEDSEMISAELSGKTKLKRACQSEPKVLVLDSSETMAT